MALMERQRLREMLEALRLELERTETDDEESRALLARVSTDVAELLGRTGEEGLIRHETLGERLRESIERFEVSHPTLTSSMGRLIDTLSQMGI